MAGWQVLAQPQGRRPGVTRRSPSTSPAAGRRPSQVAMPNGARFLPVSLLPTGTKWTCSIMIQPLGRGRVTDRELS